MDLEDLHEEFKEQLNAYALRLARDRQAAEDLVQEAFIRALGHLELLKILNPHQQRAWLFQTVKNLFLDRRAMRLREEAAIAQMSLEMDTFIPPIEPGVMGELLDGLPESHRQVLEMRYVLGMNSTQIGEELGLPPATVRSRLHLAMARLRARKSTLS